MSVDKKIDYVEQDGSLNFVKNSESVTVPKKFKARKEAPAVKLAYITDAEAKMLKKQKPGTPHKGPKGIPSYDSYGSIDSSGRDVGMSGVATSAAERGGGSGKDARELAVESQRVRSGPDLPPGVVDKNVQDYRDAFIAAGGGQRVNPSFFDSRYTVSPQEIASAKQYMNRTQFNPLTGRNERVNPYAKKSFRKTHGGGLGSLISGGGIFGNLIRGIGRAFGLGKNYNEPTYDMSQFNEYGLGGSQTPTYYNDLSNELMLSTKAPLPTLDLSKLETGDLNNLASLIKASEEPKAIAPNFMYMSPQFQEGIDNSMYGGDRMLYGSDENQVYYDGDVLPDGTVFESEADGITNYEFDEQPNEGILGIDIGEDDIAFKNNLIP
tara:strand:- start:2290 stop:3429 length:1140 start_codon:yes stop_codon:yes gene_type:complete